MSWLDDFRDIVRQDEPLAPRTWFRIGGRAQYFAEPRSQDELAALVKRCRQEDMPLRVLGGGSNVLVRDEGVPGLILHLSHPAFAHIHVQGNTITAGGGAKLGHVVSTAVRAGLAGLETLVGIPGTIGGALHGNAGSRGGDIGQWTAQATLMARSGELLQRSRKDMVFAYRHSSLDELVILGGRFELEPEDPQELTKRMQKLWILKKAEQPMAHQNAGCIFKNPRGMSAGELIEQAGLKGARIGGAEVNDRHANFIVAHQGATAVDVLRLIDLVRARVHDRLGVELELEIEIW
jgi:UDP-N-acetylmuramate dehydrogenase